MKNKYKNQLCKKKLKMVSKCLTFIFLLLSFIFCMNNAGSIPYHCKINIIPLAGK